MGRWGPVGGHAVLFDFSGNESFSYYFSDRMAISMTKSQPVSEAEVPELYAIVRRLTQRAGIPMPRLYITSSPQPNAFATGRNPSHSAVAVTEGLLHLLNRNELEGVLAHELAHVKNRTCCWYHRRLFCRGNYHDCQCHSVGCNLWYGQRR